MMSLLTKPGTLSGLTVHLDLKVSEKEDLFRWRAESDFKYMKECATAVFKKHIREMRERKPRIRHDVGKLPA